MLLSSTCGEESNVPPALTEGQRPSELSLRQIPELWAAFVRAEQAQGAAQPAFHFESATDGLSAQHASQGYAVRLLEQGVEMTVGDDRLVLGPAEIVCGQQRISSERRKAQRDGGPHRGVYLRGALTEWYENGPLGLEQGFSLQKAPEGCDRRLPLRIEFSVQGLHAEGNGMEAAFVDASRRPVLRYTDLFAQDRSGKALKSDLKVDAEGRKLVLEVAWQEALFPIEIDPLIFTEQTKVLASGKASHDAFGAAVALSADGNTALIRAWLTDGSGVLASGAVYVFVRSGASWTEQQKLLASDKASHDAFGCAVALSADGNTALIGAEGKSDRGTLANGAAYVFVRFGTNFYEMQKLLAGDRANYDAFGSTVALSGDGNTALIGADGKSDSGTLVNGAAYVFVRSRDFSQVQKLLASDKANRDFFGTAVALSGDGNTALIGANGKSDSGTIENGAAYVFVRSGRSFREQQKLLASDKANSDAFGSAVALSEDGSTALVGASLRSDRGTFASGAAYVFVRSGMSFNQLQKLLATDKASGEAFGNAAALSADGNLAIIGAWLEDAGATSDNGAAYVFERKGTLFSQQQKLLASDKASDDWFGVAVALSADGSFALLGAARKDDSGTTDNGAAYVFALPLKRNGSTCASNSECMSSFCVDGVCCDSACGGGLNTDCQACSVAAGAKSDGTCGPAASFTLCRPAMSSCDKEEVCAGSSTVCPADKFQPDGTLCAGGQCKAGMCI